MSFFNNLSANQKFIIFILLLSVVTFGVFLFTYNLIYALIAVTVIYIFLLLTKPIWSPIKNPKLTVAITSLTLIGSVITAFVSLGGLIQELITKLIKYVYPESQITNQTASSITMVILLVFTLIGIFIINYFFNRDNSAMGKLEKEIDMYFPNRDFKSKYKAICEELENDLRNLDKKTNWNAQNFVALEAEVEIITNDRRQRKIIDLLGAIKKMKRERVFLVLGEPGSGKSVALRKLCRDLLNTESIKGGKGKMPIYINLKEWRVKEKWSHENPPTVQQLKDFVLRVLCSGDINTSEFFNEYFDRLYEIGCLYFVMDSFDEIPAVLDEKENSELIDKLSEVIFKFLKGARSESQGILSSRLFRKPTDSFQTKTTLEIRPFTEVKIVDNFKKRLLVDAENIVTNLFKNRGELVPMVRNPFLSALVIDYLKNNEQKLPDNQSIAYSAYIDKMLSDRNIVPKLEDYQLTKKDVFDIAIVISVEIFERKSLEVPIDVLRKKFAPIKIDEVINILKFAKLGRGNEYDENQFSFVHRRFAEYFYVQYLIQNPQLVNFEAIPDDSQTRDALVLYCEVADFDKAKKIADFCWNKIKGRTDVKSKEIIHCLRFLSDAFRGRLECIESFRGELADFMKNQIHENNDILSIKVVLESVGLLKEDDTDEIVSSVFFMKNYWLNEIAIKSCRHLSEISYSLKNSISIYIIDLTDSTFLKNFRELEFSFNLSDSFKEIMSLMYFKFLDFLINMIGFVLLFIFILMYVVLAIDNNGNFINILSFFIIFTLKSGFFSNLYHLYKIQKSSIKKSDALKLLIDLTKRGFTFVLGIGGVFFFIRLSDYISWWHYVNAALGYILAFGFVLLFLFGFWSFCKDYYYAMKYYNSLNLSNIKTREQIQEIFLNFEKNSFKEKFINYLENNIDKIEGEWDGNFLSIENAKKTKYITRLAKLDEKWLKLDN